MVKVASRIMYFSNVVLCISFFVYQFWCFSAVKLKKSETQNVGEALDGNKFSFLDMPGESSIIVPGLGTMERKKHMPDKGKLMDKLFSKRMPRNFTKQELSALLNQCNCVQETGGRGSGIRFFHEPTGRILAFDEPHPGNELYPYQIKMVRRFLEETGERKEGR